MDTAAGHIQVIQDNAPIFDLDNETEEFMTEFNCIIDDPTLPHTEEDEHIPPTQVDVEPDPYLRMEVGIRRDPEEHPQ